MLHEGLGCVALWRDFPERLAAATGCGVFAYSRPGYGQSDPVELPRPLDYMSREALRSPARGARRDRASGAASCSATATAPRSRRSTPAASPDRRIRGLVLMAPHFFTEPTGLAAIAEAEDAYETGDLRARLARYHADVDVRLPRLERRLARSRLRAWNIDTSCWPTSASRCWRSRAKDDQYGTRAQIDALAEHLYAARSMIESCSTIAVTRRISISPAARSRPSATFSRGSTGIESGELQRHEA